MENIEETKQKSDLFSDIINFLENKEKQVEEVNEIRIIEYELDYNAKRYIQVNLKKNEALIYTYDPKFKFENVNEEKLLDYTFKVNEGLTYTFIEVDLDALGFRYKSSASYPENLSLFPVVQFLLELHDNQFPKAREFLKDIGTMQVQNHGDFARAFMDFIK